LYVIFLETPILQGSSAHAFDLFPLSDDFILTIFNPLLWWYTLFIAFMTYWLLWIKRLLIV